VNGPFQPGKPAVPFKANQDRRHHIAPQRYQVTNWPAYDAALRQRGSLTVWFSETAIAAWGAERRSTPVVSHTRDLGPSESNTIPRALMIGLQATTVLLSLVMRSQRAFHRTMSAALLKITRAPLAPWATRTLPPLRSLCSAIQDASSGAAFPSPSNSRTPAISSSLRRLTIELPS
jgi:hypothetical protein